MKLRCSWANWWHLNLNLGTGGVHLHGSDLSFVDDILRPAFAVHRADSWTLPAVAWNRVLSGGFLPQQPFIVTVDVVLDAAAYPVRAFYVIFVEGFG